MLVFARDDAINGLAVLGFHARGNEVGFDDAVRIEHVDQEFGRAMHAHTGQIRREVFAFAFELVAHGAVLGEQLLAGLEVAGLDDHGREPGDERVLFFHLRPANGVNDLAGALGHVFVRVRAQAMNGSGAQRYQVDFAGFDGGDQG